MDKLILLSSWKVNLDKSLLKYRWSKVKCLNSYFTPDAFPLKYPKSFPVSSFWIGLRTSFHRKLFKDFSVIFKVTPGFWFEMERETVNQNTN